MPNHPQREEIATRLLTAVRAVEGADDALVNFVKAIFSQTRTAAVAAREPADVAKALAATWATAKASNGGLKVDWQATPSGTLFTVAMPDQVFIIDTIRCVLRAAGAGRIIAYHAVLRLNRSEGMALGAEGDPAESLSSFEVEGDVNGAAIAKDLENRLHLAKLVVGDFGEMMQRTERAAEAARALGTEEAIEGAEFLRWTLADNFVFLGMTWMGNDGSRMTLGADRADDSALWPAVNNTTALRTVDVRKDMLEAPIHRNGRIDVVRVTLPTGQGVLRECSPIGP